MRKLYISLGHSYLEWNLFISNSKAKIVYFYYGNHINTGNGNEDDNRNKTGR